MEIKGHRIRAHTCTKVVGHNRYALTCDVSVYYKNKIL